MKQTRITKEQIAFALREAESGGRSKRCATAQRASIDTPSLISSLG